MDKIIKSLSDLNKEISNAKTNLAVLESKKADALKELKEVFGIKSVEAAERVIATKSVEVKKLKESIETKFKLLKEEYQW
jgi:adenylyl- and sulfurtransferase ThiI